MLLVFALAVTLPGAPQPAPEGKLRCYDTFTQIGTVAVRTFVDAAGRVEKEIFYTSDDLRCDPARLRVQASHTYENDDDGRPIVDRKFDRAGRLISTERITYHGPGIRYYTRTWFGPSGRLEHEIRHTKDVHVQLQFDDAGRVAAVDGPLPTDVEYSLGWGDIVDGWSCGLGGPTANGGWIVLHLRNHTAKDRMAHFAAFFDTDLRDASGRLLPLTAEFAARDRSVDYGPRTLAHPGEAVLSTLDLSRRYGTLPPGRYTLTVRHPHPETAATLISNSITFTVR